MSTRSSWAIAAAIGNDRQRGSAAAIGNDRQRPSPTIGSQDRQRPSATIAELPRSVTESSRPLSSWRLTQVPSTGENKSRASCPARYSHADMSSEINFHRQRPSATIGNGHRQRPSAKIGNGQRQRSAAAIGNDRHLGSPQCSERTCRGRRLGNRVKGRTTPPTSKLGSATMPM